MIGIKRLNCKFLKLSLPGLDSHLLQRSAGPSVYFRRLITKSLQQDLINTTVIPIQIYTTVIPIQINTTPVLIQINTTVVPIQIYTTVVHIQIYTTAVPVQIGNIKRDITSCIILVRKMSE